MRALAVFAIIGGLLRIANIFTASLLSPAALQLSYAATDAALVLGLAGFYLALRGKTGWLGVAGIAIAIAGLLAVRLSAVGVGSYQFGAAIALFGGAFLGAGMLIRRVPSSLAAVAWLGAFASALASIAMPPFGAVAALLFGVGFVVQGAVMWRA